MGEMKRDIMEERRWKENKKKKEEQEKEEEEEIFAATYEYEGPRVISGLNV